MGKFVDLTGQQFGRLTVIKREEDLITSNNNRFTRWLCKCECGNKIVVMSSSLRRTSKPTQSCGCLQKEKINSFIDNKYDFSNDKYVIGYASNTNNQFIFDKDDFEKIKNYHWYEEKDGYIRASNKDRIHLQKLILHCPDNYFVDHINHNKLDNRKINLRIVTTSQNAMNRLLASNNTSGYAGVVWVKKDNKWKAGIKINNKQIYLGLFDNKDDAIKARKQAEEKYFGKYSFDNSMKGN